MVFFILLRRIPRGVGAGSNKVFHLFNLCHLLLKKYFPSSYFQQTDNPERPIKLDEMVEALGAQSVPYLNKLACCGAGTRGVNQDTAIAMAHEKIVGAELAKADALVTVCPTCYVQYDVGQRLMAKQFDKTNLPVFVYPELLGLSMGMDFSTGFKMHTIKVAPVLEKITG